MVQLDFVLLMAETVIQLNMTWEYIQETPTANINLHLLSFTMDGFYFIDTSLPFGASISLVVFENFAIFLNWYMQKGQDLKFHTVVVGLPPHLGRVAHALGPWQWANNSTGWLDIKWVDNLFSAVTSVYKQRYTKGYTQGCTSRSTQQERK